MPSGERLLHRLGLDSGEQFVQQEAQCVDVGGGAHILTADLFGAGVLRRQHVEAGSGERRRVGPVGFEELGDPEIQQLHGAFVGDQNVRGFQIPMDHKPAMGRLHRLADLDEERQPRIDIQLRLVTVARDRLAQDQLHHDVR
jgi:hypothetical protein